MPIRSPRAAAPALATLAFAFVGAWLAFMPMHAAHAQDAVVIYRCTDAQGQLTIQNNVPCPKGSKQVRRVMDTPPAPSAAYMPPPVATAPAPEPVAPPPPPPPRPPSPLDALPPATIADADRLPPPVLFECRTWDNDHYLSDSGTPAQRCVALDTASLGGAGNGGAGAACEMKNDTCQRVPDGALCDAWRRRLREAESSLRFGVSENQDKARAELERIGLVVRDSTCGLPSP